MIAMILAAGRGERMRPLTDTCPKPLIQVNNRPLIEYHVIALKNAGIKTIVINHAWLGMQIENYLGDGSRWGINILYSAEKEGLETAGGIIKALPMLFDGTNKDNDYFLLVNGDVFTDYDFFDLIKLDVNSLAHLVMIDNPKHHEQGDFYLHDGLLSHESMAGELESLNMKKDKLTYSGIGLYHRELFKGLVVEKRPLAPLLIEAMKENKVTGNYYRGEWSDIGTIERLNEINSKLTKM